jgi:hypothetical protein
MFRLALLGALIAPLPLAAAPLPKAKDGDAPFLPTRVGDKRVSEIRGGDSVFELTEAVSEVERKGDVLRVTLSKQLNGARPAEWTFEASGTGVVLVATNGNSLATPRPYLRLPAKAGSSWTWDQEEPGVAPAKITRTVAGWEEIEVPAGRFRPLKVETKLETPRAPTLTGTYWFAAGVGEVKAVLNTSIGEQTIVLKSFTPGK